MTRRRAGTVRKLPSGRWQARYWDPADNRLCAPSTFATKGDAQRWLAATETDLGRGDWHDPRLGVGLGAELALKQIGRLGDDHRSGDERAGVGLEQVPVLGVMAIRPVGCCDERAGVDDQHSSALAETLSEEVVDSVAGAAVAGTDTDQARPATRRRHVIEDVAFEQLRRKGVSRCPPGGRRRFELAGQRVGNADGRHAGECTSGLAASPGRTRRVDEVVERLGGDDTKPSIRPGSSVRKRM